MLPCVDHDSERHESLVLPRCRGDVGAAIDDQPLSPDGSRLTACGRVFRDGRCGRSAALYVARFDRSLRRAASDHPAGCHALDARRTADLAPGSVVRLDPAVEEPVEIMAGRHVLGYGRMVLVDGKLAVQVTTRRQPSRRSSAGQDPHAGA